MCVIKKLGDTSLLNCSSFYSSLQGRGDSYAFLEVFFDDKSGLASRSSGDLNGGQRGVKRDRDEDDGAIGLSLDGDDQATGSPGQAPASAPQVAESGAPQPAPLPEDGKDSQVDGGGGSEPDGGTLKRAYDDAMAARGLMQVRRSCEKLTDLALPAKMQRTLSQEYIRQHNQGQPMGDFFSTNNSLYAPNSLRSSASSSSQQLQQQYPLQQQNAASATDAMAGTGGERQVEVPSSTTCSLCTTIGVDTQLRPCGHMFHGSCLKPVLTASGLPKCPICQTSMQSAILAVPTPAGMDGTANTMAGATSAADGVDAP